MCERVPKRAVNAFGEAVLVNRDLPTEPDTIKISQKSACSAQNLRIKICGEMNQNPGKGQSLAQRISEGGSASGGGGGGWRMADARGTTWSLIILT